jgi:tRNA dimethylallyltransferase
LAVQLAHRLDGEIVGCDSLQIYRGLDTGTGKPSRDDRARVPHHLVDHVDPREDFSLAAYVRQAESAIEQIRQRGRTPIVSGGTGLYLRGLLRGVLELSERDPELRLRLTRMIERFGTPRLHRWLAGLDSRTADRISTRDRQRIVRALELALTGGGTWSEHLESLGTWNAEHERFRTLKIGLDMERGQLAAQLDDRVDRFFRDGLVEEVRGLLRGGLPLEANAFKAIGYREVLEALSGGTDPALVRDAVKRHTRRYAKKQRTWFRKEPGVVWFDALTELDALTDQVVDLWREATW